MRAEERGKANSEARGEIPGVQFIVGDRVTLVGEVVVVSSVGSPWLIVKLDGAREHTIACWADNCAAPNGGSASGE